MNYNKSPDYTLLYLCPPVLVFRPFREFPFVPEFASCITASELPVDAKSRSVRTGIPGGRFGLQTA